MWESEAPPKLKRDPAALSNEYHKSRKQLMLWAAILFTWELVGIDLEGVKKDAGGNAGAIIVAIKSPQAVPWALIILVGYFLFKTTIEWFQSNESRRALIVSRIDFYSAWIVSLSAVALYTLQAVRNIQFADLAPRSKAVIIAIFSLVTVLASALPTLVSPLFTSRREKERSRVIKEAAEKITPTRW